ncbi:MAG: nucleotidyltransferase family protein [Hyphomicrobiales bacterium]
MSKTKRMTNCMICIQAKHKKADSWEIILQLHDERIDLLIACLKFSNSHEELATLRGTLMAEPEMLDCLLRTSDRRFMNAALVDGLGTKGILHPATPAPDKPMSTRTRLGQIRQIHEERRAAQTSALKVILSELNDQGIEPLLVKGAVSLLTGKPSWRFQRDLDFAIHPDEVERTTDVLKLSFPLIVGPYKLAFSIKDWEFCYGPEALFRRRHFEAAA